jgi:hypothetical protein
MKGDTNTGALPTRQLIFSFRVWHFDLDDFPSLPPLHFRSFKK